MIAKRRLVCLMKIEKIFMKQEEALQGSKETASHVEEYIDSKIQVWLKDKDTAQDAGTYVENLIDYLKELTEKYEDLRERFKNTYGAKNVNK